MAIDNDTSYELTGAQIKDLAQKIRNKADDNTFVGSSSGAAGSKGLVPAPAAGDQNKFLSGAGTWSDMAGSYSTTEQVTPFTWIDGKPIYKKTVDFGALPNNTIKHVNHGVANMSRIVKIDGIIQMSSANWSIIPLVYKGADSTYNAEFQVTTTYIHCSTNQDRSSLSAIITIWYTKTTD